MHWGDLALAVYLLLASSFATSLLLPHFTMTENNPQTLSLNMRYQPFIARSCLFKNGSLQALKFFSSVVPYFYLAHKPIFFDYNVSFPSIEGLARVEPLFWRKELLRSPRPWGCKALGLNSQAPVVFLAVFFSKPQFSSRNTVGATGADPGLTALRKTSLMSVW